MKLPSSKRRQSRPADIVGSSFALCMLAGTAGMLTTAIVLATGTLDRFGRAGEIVAAVVAGVATMLALSPWLQIGRALSYRIELRRLVQRLQRIDLDYRREPIAGLRSDRPDELGVLSQTIHDLLAEAAGNRLEARQLRRTMHESIRRETHRVTGRLRREASTDPLTGLGNRRALHERLDRLGDAQTCLTALHIDLDGFKPVNDALGHAVGDKCLAFLGRILGAGLRAQDGAYRVGGDEFVVLMPDVPGKTGEVVANRIAALFRQMPWPFETIALPTLSIGVATGSPKTSVEARTLIRRADESMYRDKTSKRRAAA